MIDFIVFVLVFFLLPTESVFCMLRSCFEVVHILIADLYNLYKDVFSFFQSRISFAVLLPLQYTAYISYNKQVSVHWLYLSYVCISKLFTAYVLYIHIVLLWIRYTHNYMILQEHRSGSETLALFSAKTGCVSSWT